MRPLRFPAIDARALVLAVAVLGPAANGQTPPAPEPHSAHQFVSIPVDDMVEASVELMVEKSQDAGLKFWALQVNYEHVWAHGGLQHIGGKRQSNWGGLHKVYDYAVAGNEQKTLEWIQNHEPTRILPTAWTEGRWYRYVVTRGPQETLPPGPYSVLDEAPVQVTTTRVMWRWDFTITDIESGAVVFSAFLHTQDPTIKSLTYWTETGYGVTCTDVLTAHWRNPAVKSQGSGRLTNFRISKSIAQSTCPPENTTDIQPESFPERGTVQTFGVARRFDSKNGQLLYSRFVEGQVELAACDRVVGWATDPDAPSKPTPVDLYLDNEASPRASTTAENRPALCPASSRCDAAFEFALSPPLDASVPHTFRVVPHDSEDTFAPELINVAPALCGVVEPKPMTPARPRGCAAASSASLLLPGLLVLGLRNRRRRGLDVGREQNDRRG